MNKRRWGIAIILLSIFGLAAWAATLKPNQPYRFSGKPVVEFEGRITEAETGRGLPDAFVIVNMTTFTSVPFGHGVSGCQPGSGVVKTDADGRYHFRWAWAEHGEEPPDDLSVDLKIYKPGWEYYPVLRPRISWYPVSEKRDFELIRETANFEERLDELRRIIQDNCLGVDRGDVGITMAEAVYHELWEAMCGNSAPQTLPYEPFQFTVNVMTTYHYNAFARQHSGSDALKNEISEWSSRVMRGMESQAPEYPWSNRFRGQPMPDLNHEQLNAICAYFAPSRVKELLDL